MNVKEKFMGILEKLKQLQGSPSSLARGVAIGVFLGFAPITPLKTILVLGLTFVFPANTIAAWLVCALICNPLTYIPLYYIAWFLGNILLPGRASWEQLRNVAASLQHEGLRNSLQSIGHMGLDTLLVMLAGGCVLALILACVSYPFALRFFRRLAQKRSEKHLLQEKEQ